MPEPYALTRDAVEKLRRDMLAVERQVRANTVLLREQRPRVGNGGGADIRLAKTDATTAVSGRTSTEVGTGSATLYNVESSFGIFTATSKTITVWNAASSGVATDTFILVAQDANGKWWVIVEDCG